MYHPRALARAFRHALARFPAVLVTGPRQSGKTTFLREEAGKGAAYVSFDDPLERDFAASDPEGFLSRFGKRRLILDEIQYAPRLLPHLKMRIDGDPARAGRWLLTGSQQFSLMSGVSESLAGRIAILELPPFAHAEFGRRTLETTIWNGGYPAPALHPSKRDLWLSSYVTTYLERDVRQLRNISDLRAFSQFTRLAATRHGQEFNAAALARDLGLSQPTIKAWSGLLEAAYLGVFLPPWFRNYGKRVVKTPKFYFMDSALVAFLTRQPDAASALAGPMGGALLEGWVVTETAKAYMSRGRKPEMYFWRSHDGLEVDLLLSLGGKLHAVEVKLTASPSAGHTEPLNRFIVAAGGDVDPRGIIVCRTDRTRALPGGHVAVPWNGFPGWLAERLGEMT